MKRTIKLGIPCKRTQCFFVSEKESEVLKFCFSQANIKHTNCRDLGSTSSRLAATRSPPQSPKEGGGGGVHVGAVLGDIV